MMLFVKSFDLYEEEKVKGLETAALGSGTLSPSLLLTDDDVHSATHTYSNHKPGSFLSM